MKRNLERKTKNALNRGQVINIPTSGDNTLSAQVSHYETTGSGGKLLDEGQEVCLTTAAADGNVTHVFLSVEEAQNLTAVINALVNEIEDMKNGFPF